MIWKEISADGIFWSYPFDSDVNEKNYLELLQEIKIYHISNITIKWCAKILFSNCSFFDLEFQEWSDFVVIVLNGHPDRRPYPMRLRIEVML